MRVFSIEQPHQLDPRPVGLAIGTFDGVHLGHRALLERLASWARTSGGQAGALVPDPHPMAVIDPRRSPPLLTTGPEKYALLAEAGMEWLAIMPFNRRLSVMAPSSFGAEVIAGYFAAARVAVGYNFRFGHRGLGDGDLLRSLGREFGFAVDVLPEVSVDGVPVSSSRIRGALGVGHVTAARRMLGRHYSLWGLVVPGDGRGTGLGFPTANIDAAMGVVLPADGVYAVLASVDGAWWPGVANVGVRPTFSQGVGQTERRLEVHVIDQVLDLYGKHMRVSFLQRIREEISFADVRDLTQQMRRDVSVALDIASCDHVDL